VMLFELLTGLKAVTGESVEQIFERILYQPLDTAPLKNLGLPALTDLIVRCTTKQPAQRPRSLGEVCDEIDGILHPGFVRPEAAGPPPVQPFVPVKSQPGFVQKLPAPFRTQAGLMLLAAVAMAIAVTLIYEVLTLTHVL